jgi:hypothetical protein
MVHFVSIYTVSANGECGSSPRNTQMGTIYKLSTLLYWIIRLYLPSIGKFSNPNNTSTTLTAQTDQNGTRVQITPMENHEAPTPSKELLDKWQQEAYRDYGCADAAYASVIENAAKWGYSQAMKQMYQKLQNLLDS